MVSVHEYIETQFKTVSDFSYQQKKQPIPEEEIVNKFLDGILTAKKNITEWAEKTSQIVEGLEGLSWYNDFNDDDLRAINMLLSSGKDLRTSLIKRYISFNNVYRSKGIAKEELNNLKAATDDLKEVISDLEGAFFYLPNIPGFRETTKLLSLL